MFNISFDFDETTQKVTNIQVIDIAKKSAIPEIQVLDNKIVFSPIALERLNACIGDRLSINYWTINNTTTYPIISKAEVFTDGTDGSKLTKSRTISFRGQQRDTLLKFGSAFCFEEFVDKNGDVKPFVYKLVPVKEDVESVEELLNAETQLEVMNETDVKDELAMLQEEDNNYLPF